MLLDRIIKRNKQAFIPYSLAGTALFSIELFSLWILIDYLGIPYLYATGPIFFIAVSMHYYLSKQFAFTKQHPRKNRFSYVKFLLIALGGAIAVTGVIHLLTEYTHIHPLAARALLAVITGIGTFFLHKHVTFKSSH